MYDYSEIPGSKRQLIHTCFNYSKAFDCVNQQMIQQTLRNMHFHVKLVHLIKSLYGGQQSTVQPECRTSE